MTAEEEENYDIVTKKILEMKESITNSVLNMADDVVDAETQTILINTMGDMTEGATSFSEETKRKIVNSVASIVRKQIGSSTTASKKRRRRAADNTAESTDTEFLGKTPEEVTNINIFEF